VIPDLVTVSEFAANNECQIQAEMNDQNDLSLKGCWPYQTQPTTLNFAIKNPDAYATRLIVEALKSESIELMGKVVVGKAPLNLKIIASHESKPLTELLKEVLRESNNIYADSLFKTLGAEKFQHGTFQAGTRAIQAVLTKPTGIRFADLRIVDGSGASRYNLVAPKDFARLLLTMYHDNKVGKDFINALPSSGDENGNLRYRMGSVDIKDKIRAKTGTLQGISTLAGYLTSVHDKDLIVVIAIDHTLQNGEYLKHVEDELCRVLVNFY
jgi:D-alanyl-D-alanine carboxypeptidase/D-alanyl-D-alanine-endopeptidase (penicillin-binding protein 4)